MTFDEASGQLRELIANLRRAVTANDMANAKRELSLFKTQNLPMSEKPLRSLRKIATVTLEDYKGVVTDIEMAAIANRTSNYIALIARLENINASDNANAIASRLE
jgi:hypothetical protein